VAAAVLSCGFWFVLALSPDDVGLLESPLLLAIARQLRFGPWELYGPFGGRNPLVLIHAPLYYRLTALAAWMNSVAGVEPVTAALIAGRALSVLSLIVTAAAAYRLACLDGARQRAGCWTALLLLASPVLGGTPFSVRPDMFGVALQTTGVLLVLTWWQNRGAGRSSGSWAFALFGLAFCTKQQFGTAAVITVCLWMTLWRQGQVPLKPLAHGLAVAMALVVADYGAEELASGGRMSKAVFGAAANVSRIHPGGWLHVATVFAAVIGNSVGLIALLGAATLAALDARPNAKSSVLRYTAAGSVIVLAGLTVAHLFIVRLWIGWVMLAAALAILLLVVPAGVFIERCKARVSGVDGFLAIYLGTELVLLMVLSRLSEGAWVNYAIQAIVYAAVLAARAASRALDLSARPSVSVVLTVAALAVPAAVCLDLKGEATRRRSEHAIVARILTAVGRPASDYFFAERPGHNRASGRLELVYDDWLYPVFESTGLAEQRSRWLRQFLTNGSVRVVVTTAESDRIGGVETTLPVLGYRPVGRFGPFRVFQRSDRVFP
jgi:hypothetical protein